MATALEDDPDPEPHDARRQNRGDVVRVWRVLAHFSRRTRIASIKNRRRVADVEHIDAPDDPPAPVDERFVEVDIKRVEVRVAVRSEGLCVDLNSAERASAGGRWNGGYVREALARIEEAGHAHIPRERI